MEVKNAKPVDRLENAIEWLAKNYPHLARPVCGLLFAYSQQHPAPDQPQLLEKYMRYIRDVEGSDYIFPHDCRHESDVEFTQEEWDALIETAKKSARS